MALTSNDYLFQVELSTDSNVAADNIINTLALQDTTAALSFADAAAEVVGFYTALQAYFGETLSSATDAHQIKVYRLSEPQPRPPVYMRRFTMAGGTNPFPSEVACCASFSAPISPGVVPARRRGRIFLGPLRQNTGVVMNGYLRPTSVFREAVASAMTSMIGGLVLVDWDFCVWSRKDNALFPVTHGWINDEYDTMRSRGPEVTDRTTWSISA